MVSKSKKDSGEAISPKHKHFEVMSQNDVPHGRNGKHKNIVTQILDDLAQLKEGKAMRIRLDQLPDTKERIRAALSRAVRLKGIEIVTSTDEHHLYVWHSKKGTNAASQ